MPSDNWIRELDYQRPDIPKLNIDSKLPSSRLQYHQLPADVQGRLLADINRELIDFEIESMLEEVSGQTLANQVRFI